MISFEPRQIHDWLVVLKCCKHFLLFWDDKQTKTFIFSTGLKNHQVSWPFESSHSWSFSETAGSGWRADQSVEFRLRGSCQRPVGQPEYLLAQRCATGVAGLQLVVQFCCKTYLSWRCWETVVANHVGGRELVILQGLECVTLALPVGSCRTGLTLYGVCRDDFSWSHAKKRMTKNLGTLFVWKASGWSCLVFGGFFSTCVSAVAKTRFKRRGPFSGWVTYGFHVWFPVLCLPRYAVYGRFARRSSLLRQA